MQTPNTSSVIVYSTIHVRIWLNKKKKEKQMPYFHGVPREEPTRSRRPPRGTQRPAPPRAHCPITEITTNSIKQKTNREAAKTPARVNLIVSGVPRSRT